MPTVQYLHVSMGGSYYVDCEVLEKLDNDQFKIKFYDDFAEEDTVKIVERDRLEFPKFSDLVF